MNEREWLEGGSERSWLEGERERNDQRARDLRDLADPDCRICHGRGRSSGYVAPSKIADYACPCTGQADWQAPVPYPGGER